MNQLVMWKPGKRMLAALSMSLLLGATAACSDSGGGTDSKDDSSPTDASSSADETESSDATPSATESSTVDPTTEGGYKPLPDCGKFAQPIVKGAKITEGDSTDGEFCRFSLGSEADPKGVQLAFIIRGGGQWPAKFKADDLNTILSEAGDDDRDWESTTKKIEAKGFTYGVRFHQTLGKAERTQLRLFAFAKNGDLLQCFTTADEKYLDKFEDWCGDVLEAIEPPKG